MGQGTTEYLASGRGSGAANIPSLVIEPSSYCVPLKHKQTTDSSRPSPRGKNTERVMKMKYIVNVQYTRFEFKDGTTALTFAELAKAAVVDDVSVGIELEEPEVDDTTVVDDVSEAFDFDDYLKGDE